VEAMRFKKAGNRIAGKCGMQDAQRPKPSQRGPVKMIEMRMGEVEVAALPHQVDLFFARIFLQPPAAPIDRTDQPRVGGDDRLAVFEHEKTGVADGAQFEGAALRHADDLWTRAAGVNAALCPAGPLNRPPPYPPCAAWHPTRRAT